MINNIYTYVSSLTGNTEKLATEVSRKLLLKNYCLNLHINEYVMPDTDIDQVVVLFFWCRRAGIDQTSQDFVKRCKGKKIIAVGTMGGYPDSSYGHKVRENVRNMISKQNNCCGIFLCQGRIDYFRTEQRMKLPKDNPHYLDEAGVRRHMESRKHPNEEDMERASKFLIKSLSKSILQKNEEVKVCVDGEPCIECGMCSF